MQEHFQELNEKGIIVCSCDWNIQPIMEIKGAWMEQGINLMGQILHFCVQAGIEILWGE